jgi:hypothetical protein
MPAASASAVRRKGRSRHAGADDNGRDQCCCSNTFGHNATSTIIVLIAKRPVVFRCSV